MNRIHRHLVTLWVSKPSRFLQVFKIFWNGFFYSSLTAPLMGMSASTLAFTSFTWAITLPTTSSTCAWLFTYSLGRVKKATHARMTRVRALNQAPREVSSQRERPNLMVSTMDSTRKSLLSSKTAVLTVLARQGAADEMVSAGMANGNSATLARGSEPASALPALTMTKL